MRVMNALLAVVILMTSFPAAAAEWVALPAAGATDQYFYDRSKLTIKDDEIIYWKKVVFRAPQPIHGKEAASGLLRERIHCGDHTAKLISYLYYSATNETIDYVAQDDSEPAPIIPDTVGDAFERVLCPLVWHRQEESRLKAEQKAATAELASAGKKEAGSPDRVPLPAPVVAPTPPKRPVAPTVSIQRGPQVQETLPSPLPAAPLPMPQIIEQLY